MFFAAAHAPTITAHFDPPALSYVVFYVAFYQRTGPHAGPQSTHRSRYSIVPG